MTALTNPAPISIEDYLAGEALGPVKHEYLGGQVHAMAGASNQHNAISLNCLANLHAQLRGKPCQPFNSDTKLKVTLTDHVRFYYPDATVVCQPNPPSDHFQEHPVVIVEVLSDSTRRVDLSEKRDAYSTIPSLKVLIFAESEARSVLVYRRRAQGGFDREHYAAADAVIGLPEIGASLALADLYAGAVFAPPAGQT